MVRKSKQAGGHNPLTYYERTQKFASSEYGTKQQRLAGHSQYQLGDCALSLTSLAFCGGSNSGSSSSVSKAAASAAAAASSKASSTTTTSALCSPSGYLYAEDAILEYLLTKTRELKDQQAAFERQEAQEEQNKEDEETKAMSKRKADFADLHESQTSSSQKKKSAKQPRLAQEVTKQAQQDLKRTSYWLAASQPKTAEAAAVQQPVDLRPPSPHSQQPLRRKDLWPVSLNWNTPANKNDNPQLVCSVSGKVLHTQAVTAYWTTDNYKKMNNSSSSSNSHGPGKLVLTSVYQEFIQSKKDGNSSPPKCPETNRKIKATRELQRSGSSFAASGQAVQVAKYRPTIT